MSQRPHNSIAVNVRFGFQETNCSVEKRTIRVMASIAGPNIENDRAMKQARREAATRVIALPNKLEESKPVPDLAKKTLRARGWQHAAYHSTVGLNAEWRFKMNPSAARVGSIQRKLKSPVHGAL